MTNEERDSAIKEIHEAVTQMSQSFAVSEDKVKDHSKTLYGNGRPGLCERVQKIENAHENEEKNNTNAVAWIAAIAAVVAALIPLVSYLIK